MTLNNDRLSEHFIQKSRNDNAGEGQCAKGVANILEGVGVSVTRGDAHTWKKTLPENGWVLLEGVRPEDAPSGAVAVFDRDPAGQRSGKGGSTYGHVELIAEDKNGKRCYVSDKARSNSGGTVPDNFVGVYVNPKLTPLDANMTMLASNTAGASAAQSQEKSSTQQKDAQTRILLDQTLVASSTTDLSSNSDAFNAESNQNPMMIFAAIMSALFGIDMGLDKPNQSSETQLALDGSQQNANVSALSALTA